MLTQDTANTNLMDVEREVADFGRQILAEAMHADDPATRDTLAARVEDLGALLDAAMWRADDAAGLDDASASFSTESFANRAQIIRSGEFRTLAFALDMLHPNPAR